MREERQRKIKKLFHWKTLTLAEKSNITKTSYKVDSKGVKTREKVVVINFLWHSSLSPFDLLSFLFWKEGIRGLLLFYFNSSIIPSEIRNFLL